MEMLYKRMIHILGVKKWHGMRFKHAIQNILNLKLMDCLFLSSPFNMFEPLLTMGNGNHRNQNYIMIRGV